MGCDIHTIVQRKVKNKWLNTDEGFLEDTRNYSIFGFLANVRNYSLSPIHHWPLRGCPENANLDPDDLNYWTDDMHSHTYVLLSELINYNYDIIFIDVRGLKNELDYLYFNEERVTTLRKHLGQFYFDSLNKLLEIDKPENIRIIYCFDN
jgi:hypothetical protein